MAKYFVQGDRIHKYPTLYAARLELIKDYSTILQICQKNMKNVMYVSVSSISFALRFSLTCGVQKCVFFDFFEMGRLQRELSQQARMLDRAVKSTF